MRKKVNSILPQSNSQPKVLDVWYNTLSIKTRGNRKRKNINENNSISNNVNGNCNLRNGIAFFIN